MSSHWYYKWFGARDTKNHPQNPDNWSFSPSTSRICVISISTLLKALKNFLEVGTKKDFWKKRKKKTNTAQHTPNFEVLQELRDIFCHKRYSMLYLGHCKGKQVWWCTQNSHLIAYLSTDIYCRKQVLTL